MSKATPQNVTDLGFVAASFNVLDANFTTFIQAVLDEAAVEVQAAIGDFLYGATTDPVKTRIINAEKYFAAALLEKRLMATISRTLATVENKIESALESGERDDYRAMAARNIQLILGGVNESFGSIPYEPNVADGLSGI